jgi:hypothetical protein
MPYKEQTAESRERLLWHVHDDCMDWLADSRQRTVPDSEKPAMSTWSVTEFRTSVPSTRSTITSTLQTKEPI